MKKTGVSVREAICHLQGLGAMKNGEEALKRSRARKEKLSRDLEARLAKQGNEVGFKQRIKTISLTLGLVAIVDEADYERLRALKWGAQWSRGNFYAVHGDWELGRGISMHRLVIYAPGGMEVDHINGDTLDNRRENLRLATHEQNVRNRRIISRNNSSGYKGVCFYKRLLRWGARIRFRGKNYHLGLFDSAQLAAQEYDKGARLFFGRFARTNFQMAEGHARGEGSRAEGC
jgi:hypothetical protein